MIWEQGRVFNGISNYCLTSKAARLENLHWFSPANETSFVDNREFVSGIQVWLERGAECLFTAVRGVSLSYSTRSALSTM